MAYGILGIKILNYQSILMLTQLTVWMKGKEQVEVCSS
jgi:hypothetical protein